MPQTSTNLPSAALSSPINASTKLQTSKKPMITDEVGVQSIGYPTVFDTQRVDQDCYFNRELSLLQFHQRVLAGIKPTASTFLSACFDYLFFKP